MRLALWTVPVVCCLVPAAAFVKTLAAGEDFAKRVEDGKKQFAGFELPGRTLGVVGLGAIGGLVADAAIVLGVVVALWSAGWSAQ